MVLPARHDSAGVALQHLLQLVVNLAQLGAPNAAAAAGTRQGFAWGFVVTGIVADGMCHLFHLLVQLFPDRQRLLMVKCHDAFHVARREIEEPTTSY